MNPLMQNNLNPMQMLGKFKQDPVGALTQAGYKIPSGMIDPNQIVNHLMSSGQLSNTKLGQIQQMAKQFGLIR